MAEEKKESRSWLKGLLIGAFKLATIGLLGAVGWQIFLDPIFFPIFHDPTNVTAQAFVQMINTTFSWIPDIIGLTGDWGILQGEFMQSVLEPFKNGILQIDLLAGAPTPTIDPGMSSLPVPTPSTPTLDLALEDL